MYLPLATRDLNGNDGSGGGPIPHKTFMVALGICVAVIVLIVIGCCMKSKHKANKRKNAPTASGFYHDKWYHL